MTSSDSNSSHPLSLALPPRRRRTNHTTRKVIADLFLNDINAPTRNLRLSAPNLERFQGYPVSRGTAPRTSGTFLSRSPHSPLAVLPMSEFDFIIVGQGLAGTALAWSLRWGGSRVLVIDREAPVTSSKIAAGLITPITGQRLVKSWRLDELWPIAVQIYRQVEQITATTLFHELPMVRLFSTETEVEFFAKRRASAEFLALIRQPQPLLSDHEFVTERGGFEMPFAGQLDVRRYLDVSRETFQRDGGYLTADLQPESDLVLDDSGVRLPRLGVQARQLVFCEGAALTTNPWFRDVILKPAKGEILTVRIPGLTEQRVVHRGVWLVPLGNENFRVGSTYEWQRLDHTPTVAGRDEITGKLREFLRLPFDVLDHHAAVRPIHLNQYPVIGVHSDHRQLAYFNGLGSKGTLHAPHFARELAHQLAGPVA